MSSISDIVEGFGNLSKKHLGLGDPKVEQLALEREKICLSCVHISKFKVRCTHCGCVIAAKVRSDSSCPIGKW